MGSNIWWQKFDTGRWTYNVIYIYNCTLETCTILLTSVPPINLIKKTQKRNVNSFWLFDYSLLNKPEYQYLIDSPLYCRGQLKKQNETFSYCISQKPSVAIWRKWKHFQQGVRKALEGTWNIERKAKRKKKQNRTIFLWKRACHTQTLGSERWVQISAVKLFLICKDIFANSML